MQSFILDNVLPSLYFNKQETEHMTGEDAPNIFTQLRKERMLQNFKKSQFQSTEINRRGSREQGGLGQLCFFPSAVWPCLFPMGCKWLCTLCPSRAYFVQPALQKQPEDQVSVKPGFVECNMHLFSLCSWGWVCCWTPCVGTLWPISAQMN